MPPKILGAVAAATLAIGGIAVVASLSADAKMKVVSLDGSTAKIASATVRSAGGLLTAECWAATYLPDAGVAESGNVIFVPDSSTQLGDLDKACLSAWKTKFGY